MSSSLILNLDVNPISNGTYKTEYTQSHENLREE